MRLLQELKKFKPLFLDAIADGTLPVVEKTLSDASHLKFEIREHTMLKRLRFKLKEKDDIERQLKAMKTLKELDGDLSSMKDLIQRSANIDFENAELERVKKMYAEAHERQ